MPALAQPLRTGLPALSYAGLGATTVGAIKLLTAAGMTTGYAALTIGVPVLFPSMFLLGVAAFDGGQGMVKRMGGMPASPQVVDLADEAAIAVGVPHPMHVYTIPSAEPNAFAAGGFFGKPSVVAVTQGLLDRLSSREVRAVLAHEMGHLRHRDVGRNVHVGIAAAGLGGIYEAGKFIWRSSDSRSSRSKGSKKKDGSQEKDGSQLAVGGAVMTVGLTAQAAAHLLRLCASRRAEIDADAAAAEAFGAASMISALRKIDSASADAKLRTGLAGSAVAHAMISDGKKEPGKRAGFVEKALGAFRTHPSIEDRVTALKERNDSYLVV